MSEAQTASWLLAPFITISSHLTITCYPESLYKHHLYRVALSVLLVGTGLPGASIDADNLGDAA